MNPIHREAFARYPLALLIFSIAFLLKRWIAPVDYGLSFFTFYPAMIIAFYLCGIGPGIVVSGLAAAAGFLALMRPGAAYSSAYEREIATAVFLASALMVGLISRKTHASTSSPGKSERQFERILEDQTDLICRFRSDETVLYVNDAFCRFFDKTREELVGKRWHPLVAPGYSSAVIGQLRKLTPENPVVTIENPVVAAGQVIRWGQFINRAFFDEAGRVVEIQSVGRDITKQKELEQALAANMQEFRELAEAMPQIVWITRADGHNIYFNQQWVDYTGISLEESYGHGWNKPFHPDDQKRAWDAWQNAINTRGIYSLECKLRRFDGEYRWWLVRGVPVFDDEGKVRKWFGTCTDIHESKEAELDMQVAATAFEANVGIMVTDANSLILRVNREFSAQTGYSADEVLGKTPKILQSGRHDAGYYAAMWESINRTGSWQGEVWDRHKSGDISPKLLTIAAIKGSDGAVIRYVGTHIDISEQKSAQESIRMLAFYDPLTHLPNRRLLMDRLEQAMSSSARSGRGAALMFIDLDNFKALNDTLGHAKGDLLLQQVGRRLEASVRESDSVARLSGDEFVVMLEDLSTHERDAATQTKETSEKIIAALNEPYDLAGKMHRSTASIGCAVFFDHLYSVEELMKQADIAMYQAKKDGRNVSRFFDEQMQKSINSRALLENELRAALKLGQLRLYYQVQRDYSGHPLGAEALIRWKHPERGLIYPLDFIPLSEDSDLILLIGAWVLETACVQLKAWQASTTTSALVLAVNISPKQMRQNDFVDQVQSAMQRNGIPPHLLKLELTESMLLEKMENTVSIMNCLQESGIQFSLDDFGTGYSSLQYLKQLSFDQLKIAEPFVRDIAFDENDRAIVRTIIAMGHSLNLDVIAEGVESDEQRQFLFNNGCDHYQGHLLGKALPIEEFDLLLESMDARGAHHNNDATTS
ncbi:EAL domain-containing protein [Oxalobacteraceae bacterium]|nr:EAL domain-containing protein [Oxalobacteraceae bacterium]